MMDKKLFYGLLFLAAIGFTAGSFFEIYITGDGKDQLMELLTGWFSAADSPFSFSRNFLQNFCSGLFFLLLCFLSARLPFLLIFCITLIFVQSLLYGVSASLLLETFGPAKGILYTAATVAPGALLRTLLIACFAVQAMQSWLPPIRSGKTSRRKALRVLTGPEVTYYAAGLAALFFISLLQAVLQQAAI